MQRLWMAAGMALLFVLPIQAQEDASRAIIEKAVKAQGGADKLSALKTYTAKASGSINVMGEKIGFVLEVFAEGQLKVKESISMNIGDMKIDIVKVIVGKKGWQSMNGEVADLSDEELKEHQNDMYIETVMDLYPLLKDKAVKLSSLGETKVGDKDCVGVQVAKKGQVDVNLYFDKNTNLLVKATHRGPHPITKQEGVEDKIVNEYKEFAPGVKLPSKLTSNFDGEKLIDFEITELRAVDRHDDSIFARPKRPVLLPVALPGPALQDPSQAIIDNALKAMGGTEKAASLKSMTARAKGSISFMDLDVGFTIDVFAQPPSKSKSIINVTINDVRIEIVKTFVGDKGWESVNGEVKDLTEDDIKQHKEDEHVESVCGLLALKSDKSFKLSPLGETKVGDAACEGVQVTKQNKRDVNLYFDKKTHLLVKAEYRGLHPFSKEEVTNEKLFSEYKELVPGLKTASKQMLQNDGKKFMELEMLEIQPVERHDESIFARPKQD